MELSKTFCCFCCASGPLQATIALPATGFVPGQGVPIHADVENASNVTVDRLKILLRKVITYRTNTPRVDTKKEKTVISELAVGPGKLSINSNLFDWVSLRLFVFFFIPLKLKNVVRIHGTKH